MQKHFRLRFAAEIQIPIPNKYLGLGYKGLLFIKIMVEQWKLGQGTHCTKMGADRLAEIPQISQNLSVQFVYPSQKIQNLIEKGFFGHPQSVLVAITINFIKTLSMNTRISKTIIDFTIYTRNSRDTQTSIKVNDFQKVSFLHT